MNKKSLSLAYNPRNWKLHVLSLLSLLLVCPEMCVLNGRNMAWGWGDGSVGKELAAHVSGYAVRFPEPT